MIYGLIPCAGKAQRMQPLPFSKEILPLFIRGNSSNTPLEHNIQSMFEARAENIQITIHPRKKEVKTHLASNTALNSQKLIFKKYISPSLPHSIASLKLKVENSDIILIGLGDTYWQPHTAFSVLVKHLDAETDLVFGLFNSAPASEFDSVSLNPNKHISKILVKKPTPASEWFWGIMAFSGRGYKKFINQVKKYDSDGQELIFGEIIQRMIDNGTFVVKGIKLQGNAYFDLGTPERYFEFLSKVSFKNHRLT